MADIEAVDLVSAHQVVTERLRHAIHIGTYLPGDKLPPERMLAQQLGVSRMTVREAVRVLRAEGYVSSRRGSAGGITVLDQAEDSKRLRQALLGRMDELDDNFEFRIAVEGAAARLAAQRRTKDDLARLRDATSAMSFSLHRPASMPSRACSAATDTESGHNGATRYGSSWRASTRRSSAPDDLPNP